MDQQHAFGDRRMTRSMTLQRRMVQRRPSEATNRPSPPPTTATTSAERRRRHQDQVRAVRASRTSTETAQCCAGAESRPNESCQSSKQARPGTKDKPVGWDRLLPNGLLAVNRQRMDKYTPILAIEERGREEKGGARGRGKGSGKRQKYHIVIGVRS